MLPIILSLIIQVSFAIQGKAQCLKITQKVSFKMASEASYVFILSGQKLIKSAKNVVFWQVFDNYKLAVKEYYQRILMGQKLVENVELKNSN